MGRTSGRNMLAKLNVMFRIQFMLTFGLVVSMQQSLLPLAGIPGSSNTAPLPTDSIADIVVVQVIRFVVMRTPLRAQVLLRWWSLCWLIRHGSLCGVSRQVTTGPIAKKIGTCFNIFCNNNLVLPRALLGPPPQRAKLAQTRQALRFYGVDLSVYR